MADFQQVLQRVAELNRGAQEALPVIPNNGNPGGVYNMPRDVTAQQKQSAVTAQQKVDKYAWLNSSPSLENIRNRAASIKTSQAQQPVIPQTNGYV